MKVTTASKGLTEHLLRAGKDGGKPDFFGPAPAAARFVSTSVKADGMKAMITGDLRAAIADLAKHTASKPTRPAAEASAV